MRIGVLGTGEVGQALGRAFATLGHEVKMGSRTAGNEKAVAWAEDLGEAASQGTFGDAAEFGEVLVLATLGTATLDILAMAGHEHFAGKVVIDATNPLDFSAGPPPTLFVGHTDSLGEQIQRAIPDGKVVKCFNTVGNAHMFRPDFPGGPPTMFICGDDDDAKAQVSQILDDFGWEVLDIGGIEGSRHLEPFCLVWVLHGVRSGQWNHAFKMLHK